jgi:MFS family permease
MAGLHPRKIPWRLASDLRFWLFFLLTYPAFNVIASGVSLATIMLVQFGLGVMLAITSGVSPTAISEIFPTHNRTTWMSIGYTLSVTIFGGFAPFIAAWLIKETGSSVAPKLLCDGCGGNQLHRYRPDAGNRAPPA